MISDLPTQHHAVEGTDEETIDKLLVKDRHPNNSSNKVEKFEMMFVVETGVRIDLESVHIIGRVLEQSVVRIEQFGGEKEEPFSRHASIVLALFTHEIYPQLSSELIHSVSSDLLNLVKRVFHHSLSSHVDLCLLSDLQSFYSFQQIPGLFLV